MIIDIKMLNLYIGLRYLSRQAAKFSIKNLVLFFHSGHVKGRDSDFK